MTFTRLAILAIGLWLVATLASFGAQIPTEGAWLPVILEAVSYISTVALGLLVVAVTLWGLWRFIRPMLTAPVAAVEEEPEAVWAAQTVANLSQLLAEAEQDTSKASLLLLDAELYAASLVGLVKGIALKAEMMMAEIDGLQAALDAITSKDPLQISRAAGLVKDEHIRSLMLCDVRHEDYWLNTARLISVQLGTLQQWEQGYRRFVSNLLADLAEAKARLAASTAALELTGASRPLLQIRANLVEAGEYLRLDHKPGLRQAAKALPSINAGLR